MNFSKLFFILFLVIGFSQEGEAQEGLSEKENEECKENIALQMIRWLDYIEHSNISKEEAAKFLEEEGKEFIKLNPQCFPKAVTNNRSISIQQFIPEQTTTTFEGQDLGSYQGGFFTLIGSYHEPNVELVTKGWIDPLKNHVRKLKLEVLRDFVGPYVPVSDFEQNYIRIYNPGTDHIMTGSKILATMNFNSVHSTFGIGLKSRFEEFVKGFGGSDITSQTFSNYPFSYSEVKSEVSPNNLRVQWRLHKLSTGAYLIENREKQGEFCYIDPKTKELKVGNINPKLPNTHWAIKNHRKEGDRHETNMYIINNIKFNDLYLHRWGLQQIVASSRNIRFIRHWSFEKTDPVTTKPMIVNIPYIEPQAYVDSYISIKNAPEFDLKLNTKRSTVRGQSNEVFASKVVQPNEFAQWRLTEVHEGEYVIENRNEEYGLLGLTSSGRLSNNINQSKNISETPARLRWKIVNNKFRVDDKHDTYSIKNAAFPEKVLYLDKNKNLRADADWGYSYRRSNFWVFDKIESAPAREITLAECPIDDVVIQQWRDLHDFKNRYSNCTTLPKNLVIWEAEDLSAFSKIKTIKGDLVIQGNKNLTSLAGLSNLETVEGKVTVKNNFRLSICSGDFLCNKKDNIFIGPNGNNCGTVEQLQAKCRNNTPPTTTTSTTAPTKTEPGELTGIYNHDYPTLNINVDRGLAASNVRKGTESMGWLVKNIGGASHLIESASNRGQYLYIEYSTGKLLCKAISPTSRHAQWTILEMNRNPGGKDFFRIANLRFPQMALSVDQKSRSLKAGPATVYEKNSWWKLESLGNTNSGNPTTVSTSQPTTRPTSNPTTRPTSTATNIAYQKRTRQSSTFSTHKSSYAVDGNTKDRHTGAGNKFTTTQSNTGAWWEVDLGANYNISQINIHNVTDQFKSRLRNLNISVSETTFRNNNDGQAFATNVYPNSVGNYQGNATGRYVRVFITRKDYLNLCEVEIFGTPADSGSAGNNVALEKPTRQSSTFSVHKSSYAVDGNTNDRHTGAGNKFTTTNNDQGAWWEVDLGRSYQISQINVYNVTDNFGSRLKDLNIKVSNTSFRTNNDGQFFARNVYPQPKGEYRGNATGRYVRVYINRRDYLNLCEVEVIGR